MFPLDVHTHKLLAQDRIESLRAAGGGRRLRRRAGLRLPFATAELEPAPRALPGAVHPAHVGAAAPAGFDLAHAANLRGRPDAPCYTRSAGRRSSVG